MRRLNKELRKAIRDEKLAPRDYMRLRKNLKSKRDKKTITGIIKQERSHFRKVKKILRRLK